MGNINGIDSNTRVGTQIQHLENIGDQLRVHFGNKREGTKGHHIGPQPKVLKGGSMKKMGPGYAENIWQYNSEGFSGVGPEGQYSWEALVPLYEEFFDTDISVGQMTEPIINTIQIPGAKWINIKMSYATNYAGNGLDKWNYMWIGKGLHGDASELKGEYLPDFTPLTEDWEKLPGHDSYCMSCGRRDWWADDHNCGIVTGPSWAPDGGSNGNPGPGTAIQAFYVKECGPLLPLVERSIDGDSFTFAWMVDFTGNAYTNPDESCYIGYYMEITPYGEDWEPMTTYDYIVGEVPRSYAIGDMSYEIAKLNNYPNAEEVKF